MNPSINESFNLAGCGKAYYIVFLSQSILLHKDTDGEYSLPYSSQPPTSLFKWTKIHTLPLLDGAPCYAYSIASPPADGLPPDVVTVGLRESYHHLPAHVYNMAGKAAELIYWDSNTRYCGVCGAPMKQHTDISKRCTNCGKEIWPQLSPAIIVRVRRIYKGRAEILLVRAHNFKRDHYGLVAGFVETGETLEECVLREVKEETGLNICNIRYFGSQPWPYPCGIMIGFTADYVDGEIHLQDEELSNGGWYDVDHLPPLPGKMSIARELIDDWIDTIKKV